MGDQSYAKAGVDIRKVKRIHSSLAGVLAETFSLRKGRFGEPLIPIGHYAGLVDIGHGRALALHTDGVGTKALIAQLMEKYETVGIDCVAMTVNDLACLGCEPVAILDYIALEHEDDQLVSELAKGLVVGARQASAAIVGGETAVMGEVIRGVAGHGFDLVTMGVGVVEKDRTIDGSRIEAGDAVVGVASSGLHSNGFTLARRVLLKRHGVKDEVPGLGRPLGEELLTPTLIYTKGVAEVLKTCDTHGIAHITGGGFSKLLRLTRGRRLSFVLRDTKPQRIFEIIRKEGGVTEREMYRTFNMGVGLCFMVPPDDVSLCISAFARNGFDAFELGRVSRGSGVSVGATRVA